jgi:cytochrome oxidase Cu insertion factor (SCO1/SenC/PrrC family)
MATKRGRIWVFVMLVIIVVLPLFSVLFLKEGFKIRDEAPASSRMLNEDAVSVPAYHTISHRGDTITKKRMLGKVCLMDFASYSCGSDNDARERKLFELQEDYYGKTKAFRIISHTLQPESDLTPQLTLMAERYAAREIWHFVGSADKSSIALFDFANSFYKNSPSYETDTVCPELVYLVDGEGLLRGVYNPLVVPRK